MVASWLNQNRELISETLQDKVPWAPGLTRWQWFEGEYRKAFEHAPPVSIDQIADNQPIELQQIADTFLHLKPGKFAEFQARFNFLIALFPLSSWQTTVFDACFAEQKDAGVEHREYRVFLDFKKDGWEQIFARAIAKNLEAAGEHTASIVVSMPHNEKAYLNAYKHLKDLFAVKKDYLKVFAGFDFCMFEESYDPRSKVKMLEATRQFEPGLPEIQLLMHVGETLESIDLLESLQRIQATLDAGATRLGHACSLAREAQTDTEQELQQALVYRAIKKSIVVESCPTSNNRIAQMAIPCVGRFAQVGLPYVVCSDDPGILATSLREEIELAKGSLDGKPLAQATALDLFPYSGC